ncbi:MAG: hypothetical protein ACLFVW_01755, partial [Phycisphaerae bacterium]
MAKRLQKENTSIAHKRSLSTTAATTEAFLTKVLIADQIIEVPAVESMKNDPSGQSDPGPVEDGPSGLEFTSCGGKSSFN